MFQLNDVPSSESSADSDESSDEVDDLSLEGPQMTQTVVQPSQSQPTRTKRDIRWCGVEDEGSSSASGSSRIERRTQRRPSVDPYDGVPLSAFIKGKHLQLFCQTGYFLAIYPDGKVRGTQDLQDPHTRLEMIPTGYPGHVVIRGLLSNLYVAMNKKGRLRAQGNRDAEMSVFIEGLIGFYMYYLSRHFAHEGWYLGIKKTGKFKNGMKTKLNQKAVRWVKRI